MQEIREDKIKKLAWMLGETVQPAGTEADEYIPPYGDVTELNSCRLVMDSVGTETLKEIGKYAARLLDTSVAIHEANGDYAFGMFSSGWCRLMDSASRELCKTDDNRKALSCGKWLCHENCWNDSAKKAIETGKSTDIACVGGIHLYAEPIYAGQKVVGVINIGYGDPPESPDKLKALSELFDVDPEKLKETGAVYKSRPEFIIDVSKKLLGAFAKIIGEIVEKAEAKTALEKSEEKYRLIAENMADIITTLDMDLNFTYVSPSITKLRGFTVEEALGQRIDQIMTPESLERLSTIFAEELSREQTGTADPDRARIIELEEYKKDGTTIWVENTTSFIRDNDQNPVGILVVSRDITERKQTQEALRKSEALLREAQHVAKIGHWELDAPSGTPLWSEEIFRIFGLDPKTSEPSFAAHQNIIHADDWGFLWQSIQDLSDRGIPFDIEFRILRPEGEIRWMHARGSAEKGGDGSTPRMFGTAQDITDRKAAEEALNKSEERFSLAMKASRDGIWDWDLTTGEIYCSPGLTSMLGYDSTDVIKNEDDWQGLIHPEDSPKAYKANLDCVNNLTDSFEVEYRMKTRDGDLKWILGRGQAVYRDASGKALRMIGTHQDITEKKHAEEALRQAYKMEAIGTLAGGIAHEFNNMLGIIIGNTELALHDITESDPAADCLQEIRTASLRAKDVVRKLLNVARKTAEPGKPVQIRAIVAETVSLLRKTVPASIEIRSTLSCTTEKILADPTEINQVLLNLCTNSVYAMGDGKGVLEVTLETRSLDSRSSDSYEDIAPGKYAKLTVSDDGKGISPDIIDRVFDPYFTTKNVDQGLGLGLAVVHGIVKKHGGDIKIESKPGKGTTVEVLFPVIEGREKTDAAPPGNAPGGSARILVVDDEQALVKMLTKILTRLGYEVVGTTSSREGLKLFEAEPGNFDLVITDMAMPHMTGDQMALAMFTLRPDIPVILCTGHSEQLDEEKALELGISSYYMKPYSIKGLSETIRNVLGTGK